MCVGNLNERSEFKCVGQWLLNLIMSEANY